MSEANGSSQDIFTIGVCSQCLQPFPQSAARDKRDACHALPCGHVFCQECVSKAEAEQKSGKPRCRRAGCERELAPVSEFAISWIAQRAVRINASHEGVFGDQGNVGDRRVEPPTCTDCDPDPSTGKPHVATHRCETCGNGAYLCSDVATAHPKVKPWKGHVVVALAQLAPFEGANPAWSLCAEHKLLFRVADASTQRPLCVDCLSAARGNLTVQPFDDAIAALDAANDANSDKLVLQKCKLAEPTFTAEEFRAKVAKWEVEETARIKAGEEREVKHVQAVASETVQLVQDVCARRLEVGASLLTQRTGLRASLEEFDQALADLPSDPAARLSKKRAVYAERKRLCELLAGSMIAVPSAQEVLKWAELPALPAAFDHKGADNGGVLANAVSAAARATLVRARTSMPEVPARAPEEKAQAAPASSSRKGVPAFPVIPKLVRCSRVPRRLRVCFHPFRTVLVCLGAYPFTPHPPPPPAALPHTPPLHAGRGHGPALDPHGRQAAERLPRSR